MATEFSVESFTVTGGTPLDISRGGKAFILIEAATDVDVIAYRNESEVGRAVAAPAGLVIPLRKGFDRIRLSSSVTVTAKLGISEDPLALQALKPTVSIAGSAALDGSGSQAIADATTDTIAANSDRRELLIQADPANSGNLAVRDSGGNELGVLQAGQSITLETTAAVQVRNDTGAGQTYRYGELS